MVRTDDVIILQGILDEKSKRGYYNKGEEMKKRERIKKTILKTAEEEGLTVSRIILFGSRARGEAKRDSDWDVLVVVEEHVGRKKKWELAAEIRCRLRDIPIDVLIKTKGELKKYENFYGTATREALKEGVAL